MSRNTPVSEWPVAAITVRLDRAGEYPALSVDEIEYLVQEAIKAGGESFRLRFITKEYFDNVEGIALGQDSVSSEHQFIVVPEEEPQPFFFRNRSYGGVRIISYTWSGSRTMGNPPTERDIIAGVKGFAARLESAYVNLATSWNTSAETFWSAETDDDAGDLD